jgi:hypothetical protein
VGAKRASHGPYRKHLTFRHRAASLPPVNVSPFAEGKTRIPETSHLSVHTPGRPAPSRRSAATRVVGHKNTRWYPVCIELVFQQGVAARSPMRSLGPPLVWRVCDGRFRQPADWLEPNDDRDWLIGLGKCGYLGLLPRGRLASGACQDQSLVGRAARSVVAVLRSRVCERRAGRTARQVARRMK